MRIQVDVEFLKAETTFDGLWAQNECNVSNANEAARPTAFRGSKGFHLSQSVHKVNSPLDGSHTFYGSEGYRGFCSQKLAPKDSLEETYLAQVSLHGIRKVGNPEYLFVCFDAVQGVWATEVEIETGAATNVIFSDLNSPYLFIPLKDIEVLDDGHFVLYVKKWNKPFTNIKISYVSFGFAESYGENTIKTFRCSEKLLGDSLNADPGIMQQYAEITMQDYKGNLAALLTKDLPTDNLAVAISAIDDQEDLRYVLGEYLSDEWSVLEDDALKLSCSDVSKNFSKIPTDPLPIKDRSLEDFLVIAFNYANVAWEYIDSETAEYCKGIVTPNSWMYGGTLTEMFEKICNFGLLSIYWYIDRFIVARCF